MTIVETEIKTRLSHSNKTVNCSFIKSNSQSDFNFIDLFQILSLMDTVVAIFKTIILLTY